MVAPHGGRPGPGGGRPGTGCPVSVRVACGVDRDQRPRSVGQRGCRLVADAGYDGPAPGGPGASRWHARAPQAHHLAARRHDPVGAGGRRDEPHLSLPRRRGDELPVHRSRQPGSRSAVHQTDPRAQRPSRAAGRRSGQLPAGRGDLAARRGRAHPHLRRPRQRRVRARAHGRGRRRIADAGRVDAHPDQRRHRRAREARRRQRDRRRRAHAGASGAGPPPVDHHDEPGRVGRPGHRRGPAGGERRSTRGRRTPVRLGRGGQPPATHRPRGGDPAADRCRPAAVPGGDGGPANRRGRRPRQQCAGPGRCRVGLDRPATHDRGRPAGR